MKHYSVTDEQLKTMAKNCGCPPSGVKTVGNLFSDCKCKEKDTRIEELERKLNLNIDDFTQAYTDRSIDCEKYRRALVFYADKKNWKSVYKNVAVSEVSCDKGKIASKALEEVQDEQ